MFVMQEDPQVEKKERQEEYMLMQRILQEERQQANEGEVVEYRDVQEEKQQKAEKLLGKLKGTKKIAKNNKEKMAITITKNKKSAVEKALKDFIPEGIKIARQQTPSQKQYAQLLKIEEAEQFSLNFKSFLGKILKVTDGDTVKIAFKLAGAITRFSFRLNGVDTPESRSGQVKQFGQYVKQVLRRMLQGKVVRVEAGEFDKYGRPLSRIFAFANGEQFCVNDFLIQNDLAKPYSGKTKDQFTVKDYEQFKQKFNRASWPEVVHFPRNISK